MDGTYSRSDYTVLGREPVEYSNKKGGEDDDRVLSMLRFMRFEPVSEERKAEIIMLLSHGKKICTLDRDRGVDVITVIAPVLLAIS
jgi:hypothetical protein